MADSGGAVAENCQSVRKFRSKWDLKQDASPFPLENGLADASLMGNDEEAKVDVSPKSSSVSAQQERWSHVEPSPRGRGSHRVDDVAEGGARSSKELSKWDDGDSYERKMSPGLDGWRHQNSCHSPRKESKRRRSESSSRSRSPKHGSRGESSVYDRSRSSSGSGRLCKDYGAGSCWKGGAHHDNDDGEKDRRFTSSRYSSSMRCKDFLKGSCRRGSSCKFTHDDTYGASDHPNSASTERQPERRSRDADHDWHGIHATSDVPCKFFAVGNCRNGRYCRFSHTDQECRSHSHRDADRWSRSQDSDEAHKWGGNPNASSSSLPSAPAPPTRDDGPSLPQDKADSRWAGSNANPCSSDPWPKLGSNSDDKNGASAVEGTQVEMDLKEATMRERGGENWFGDMEMSPDWNPVVKSSRHHADSRQLAAPSSMVKSELDHIAAASSDPPPFLLQNLNVAGQTQPQAQAQTHLPLQEDGGFRLTIGHVTAAQTISGAAMADGTVSGEKLTQLSTLSASLAQLLANGQQLPQLYAAHNPLCVAPAKPDYITTEVPGEPVRTPPLKQEPLPDSTEQRNEGDDGKLGSSASAAPAEKKAGEKKPTGELGLNSKDAQAHGSAEDGHGSGNGGDGLKSGEAKAIRAFKFALVEFVKELLKPTWRDGQLSKDAYKNIVKKVVDKVTSSVQGAIPQTEEKIDHYLSYSKAKLSKLVQAYVEKNQRGYV